MMRIFRFFPIQASELATRVDHLALGLLGFSIFILIIVFGGMIGFSVLYRKGSPRPREINLEKKYILEWSWSIGILAAFLVLFYWGSQPYIENHQSPSQPIEIMVIGKQWMWKFRQPDGYRELNELHIPEGRTVLLTMTSEDVIHSLFIPEFRIKQDVLPGRYTRVWFEPSRAGTYRIFCSQYCGGLHAQMLALVNVMGDADYKAWQKNRVEMTMPAERGRHLFSRFGCTSCHGLKSSVQAPSLLGVFGKMRELADGQKVKADEDYLRESIFNPNSKVVHGFTPTMPSYLHVATEEDVLDLIAYIKSLVPQGANK